MTPLEQFYSDDPRWYEMIGGIHALLERVKISEEQSGDVLHRRKLSRILSIHASTAIEGNRLSLGQVADVINGTPARWTAARSSALCSMPSAIRCTDTSTSRPKPVQTPV